MATPYSKMVKAQLVTECTKRDDIIVAQRSKIAELEAQLRARNVYGGNTRVPMTDFEVRRAKMLAAKKEAARTGRMVRVS